MAFVKPFCYKVRLTETDQMADEVRKDLVILARPWRAHSDKFRANVAETGGEIRTFDYGLLKSVDGRWEVLASGDLNEADIVLNALRAPN